MFQRKVQEEDVQYEGDPSAPHPGSVGHLLRSTRESLGWELRDVGAALRIRAEYLDALERNTVEGLPGVAYATGFLRAYADYLGLDGNEIVSRFKAEKKTLASRPELSFPVPLTDRGIPGSGFFLIAALLIALAYGTWYYMSSGEHPTPPAVEPVPARLLEPPQAAAPAPEQSADAAKPAADGAATVAIPPAPVATATTGAAAPVAAAPVAPPAPTAITVPAGPAAGTPSIGAPQIAAGKPPAKTAPAVTTPAPGAPPPTAAPTTVQNADGTPPAVPPADAAPAADSKEPKTYGAFANPGRIVVKATGYAWVQVYDGKEAILTRTLHPGDSYYVPAKPGLIMRTGNAGGLAFVVDGKQLPAIGPTGMVKKKIPLDPQRLLSGDLGEDVPPTPPKPAAAAPAPVPSAAPNAAPAAAPASEDTPE